MAESTSGARELPDPFQIWRDWITQSEQQLNRLFNDMMATDQFGQSSGKLMDLFLAYQRAMSQATEVYFNALNIPTRTDVLSLGERLTAIEERLVGVENALRALGETPTPAAKSAPKPKRTKKPAKKTAGKGDAGGSRRHG